jgi:DNA polymerase-3 subunit gamma/tau
MDSPQEAGALASEAPKDSDGEIVDAHQYQALYRRFRPQLFRDLIGQQHVALALSNAISTDKVAHAYMFSGPRGTGKTSCARILAKALNCTDRIAGEPCDACASCTAIKDGSSLDVYELDAASNSGVDSIRELISKTSLATPGRWKVYIIDEIHMLSTAASNALLKTLEEPPAHVVFVLATTDPQKVIPTIRSRTQHYEFHLLGAEELTDLLADVSDRAQLPLPQGALAAAMRRARGSARDALSSLEQISILGRVDDEEGNVASIAFALADGDVATVLMEVARTESSGMDPARLAVELVDYLRQGFLGNLAPQLSSINGSDLARAIELTSRMGLASLVRAMELLGSAMVDMRDSLDPRTQLESVLLKLCSPETGSSYSALLERVERLERTVASMSSGKEVGADPPDRPSTESGTSLRDLHPGGLAKPALGAFKPSLHTSPSSLPGRQVRREDNEASGQHSGELTDATDVAGAGGTDAGNQDVEVGSGVSRGASTPLSKEAVVMAWGDTIVNDISRKAKGRYVLGRFVRVDGTTVTFALPNAPHMRACAELRDEVEAALSRHFGMQITLELLVDSEDAGHRDEVNGKQSGEQTVISHGASRSGRDQQMKVPQKGLVIDHAEDRTAGQVADSVTGKLGGDDAGFTTDDGEYAAAGDTGAAGDTDVLRGDLMSAPLPIDRPEPRTVERRPPEEHIREFFPGAEEI